MLVWTQPLAPGHVPKHAVWSFNASILETNLFTQEQQHFVGVVCVTVEGKWQKPVVLQLFSKVENISTVFCVWVRLQYLTAYVHTNHNQKVLIHSPQPHAFPTSCHVPGVIIEGLPSDSHWNTTLMSPPSLLLHWMSAGDFSTCPTKVI